MNSIYVNNKHLNKEDKYFDTHDHLADFLFEHEHVSITVEGEFGDEDEPYGIILCRIAREDRESFLHAVELLPSLMAYVGKTDYDVWKISTGGNISMGKRWTRPYPL